MQQERTSRVGGRRLPPAGAGGGRARPPRWQIWMCGGKGSRLTRVCGFSTEARRGRKGEGLVVEAVVLPQVGEDVDHLRQRHGVRQLERAALVAHGAGDQRIVHQHRTRAGALAAGRRRAPVGAELHPHLLAVVDERALRGRLARAASRASRGGGGHGGGGVAVARDVGRGRHTNERASAALARERAAVVAVARQRRRRHGRRRDRPEE
mmetsp:Transcript_10148/g.35545  ORF Transcript_10148/g.35545 Transcript_10148/m.35545 type:complete len:209 (-) Transcript_10148:592-1218(-)